MPMLGSGECISIWINPSNIHMSSWHLTVINIFFLRQSGPSNAVRCCSVCHGTVSVFCVASGGAAASEPQNIWSTWWREWLGWLKETTSDDRKTKKLLKIKIEASFQRVSSAVFVHIKYPMNFTFENHRQKTYWAIKAGKLRHQELKVPQA